MKRAGLLLLYVLVCVPCASSQIWRERSLLRGLASTRVEVVGPGEAISDVAGIYASNLKTQIELKLRQAGLRIMDKPGSVFPLLSVVVNSTRGIPPDDPLYYAVSTDVELTQPGHLVAKTRADGSKVEGSDDLTDVGTWHDSQLRVYGSQSARSNLRRDILDVIDSFLNDYLAENPKK